MIRVDFDKKEIHFSEDCSLDVLASYLYDLDDSEFKIYIDGIDEETDIGGDLRVP